MNYNNSKGLSLESKQHTPGHLSTCQPNANLLKLSNIEIKTLLDFICLSWSLWAAICNKCHRVDGLNNKHLFVIILEIGKCKTTNLVSGENSLPGCRWQPSYCVLTWLRKTDHLSVTSLLRTLIPFMRSLPSWPNYLPKPHLQIPTHWELGFQNMKGEEAQTFSPQQCSCEICESRSAGIKS